MMRHRRINHHQVAAILRAQPGVWKPVGEYNSSQSAEGAVYYIHTAATKHPRHQSPYAPAGAYEARCELTELGARVEARYVGVSPDVAWADAVAALDGGAL